MTDSAAGASTAPAGAKGAASTAERVEVVSSDGARSEISVSPGPGGEGAPVAICLPAMGVAATFYRPLAEALGQERFHVITCDLRGIGSSSVRAGRGVSFGYPELLERDIPAVVAAARARFPRSPVYLLGHSLGGQLAALYLAVQPEAVDGVVLVAAGSVYFRAYPFPHSVRFLLGTQLARAISSAWGYFPGHKLGFAGREARGVIRDWSRQARTGRYDFVVDGAIAEDLFPRARGSVLAISVEDDVLAPVSAVDHICGKLANADVSRWHYVAPDGARIDHFRWVKRPAPVAAQIRAWVDGLSSRSS